MINQERGLLEIEVDGTSPGKTVLVVEDEGLIAMDLKSLLESFGYFVPAIAKTANDALVLTRLYEPDLILMDIRLKGGADGIQVAESVLKLFEVPIIFVTAHADTHTLDRAMRTEPFGYIVKPFGAAEIRAQIEMALYKHKIERKLRRSEAWFAATIRNIGDAVITTGLDGKVEFMNPMAERLTGWALAEARGVLAAKVFDLIDSNAAATLNSALGFETEQERREAGVFNETEHSLRNRAGSISTIASTVSVNRLDDQLLGALIVFRDVTAQRETERKARQNGTMEAISIMAGSLAHDFNNLLTVILGFADIIQSNPARKCEEVEKIRRAGQQGARLASQLLTISRRDLGYAEVLDLSDVTLNARIMIRRVVGHSCALTFCSCPTPLPVRAVEAQIQEILVGLAVTAREAMSHGQACQLTITTAALPGLAVLEMSDTGVGMDTKTQDRIFEPFLNREGGMGSALGMTMVHSLVAQNGGTIDVKSELGKGTTFQILLPLTRVELDTPPVTPRSETTGPESWRVLVVDDNEEIRMLLHEQFSADGFVVLHAPSGTAALALLAAEERPVDLLITDVMMPGMSGPELASLCLARYHQMRVLFISGYSPDDLRGSDLFQNGRADFVRKPMLPRILMAKARAMLLQPVLANPY